ncbi:hypothetical protein [Nocardia amamiensis]|uniref:hypothetical protein n=1 Tax=Nocardia amamiensis TaxID=404578 RepID=UPI0009FDA918|nr:hypothetical protein [Nocardia amamiensis]
MSDHNGEGHRTRRRAVRSAGPPVEETTTGSTTGAKTSAAVGRSAGTPSSTLDSGPSSLVAETEPTTSVAKQVASQEMPDSGAPTAEVAEATVAKTNADAEPNAAVAGKAGVAAATAGVQPDQAGRAAVAAERTVARVDGAEADETSLANGIADAEPDAVVVGKAGVAAAKADAEPNPADQAAVAGGDGGEADKTSLTKGNTEDTAEADQTAVAAAGTEAQRDTDEDSPTEKQAAQTRNRSVARILTLAASALLVLALVCGATVSVFAMRSAHERDERRAEYLQTARQAIVNLTTIRADSAKQDIDRILSLASGEFKTEFDGRVDPFTSIVQQAKVVSSGEIVEAALESDDDRSARVLVAAKQTLTNAGQAEPQTRYYRFRVTVSRGDTGLTVSDVEFVA